MKQCTSRVRLLGTLLAVGISGTGFAQTLDPYPSRSIRLIVPFSPGGSSDWVSRLVGQRLTEVWGQQVLVDNRPGANTVIGTEAAVRSKPDGYTLLNIGNSLCVNATLMKTAYDPVRDLAAIATLSRAENLLAVHPALPVKTVKEFVALAKARPGELSYATSAHGGSTHLGPELLNMVAGIKTTQIPYKGGGPAVIDLVGGHVQFIMAIPINIVAHVRNGRLRAIAITGNERLESLPAVPSFAEAGYPEVSLSTWQAYAAPAGTPRAILDRLAGEIEKLAATPQIKKQIESQGMLAYFNGPDKTAALIKSDIARFAKIIKAANIKPETGG